MKFGMQLLARFGLLARKSEPGPDAFDMRLQRIGTRERRHTMRQSLFRPLLQPVEA